MSRRTREIPVCDLEFLEETLIAIKDELETLVKDKEWYVTDCLDMIESSLEIITRISEE